MSRFVRKPVPVACRYGIVQRSHGFSHWAAGYRTPASFWFGRPTPRFLVTTSPCRCPTRCGGHSGRPCGHGHHRRCADGRFVARPSRHSHRRGVTTPKLVPRAALRTAWARTITRKSCRPLPQTPPSAAPRHGAQRPAASIRRECHRPLRTARSWANLADVAATRPSARAKRQCSGPNSPAAHGLCRRRPQAYPLMSHSPIAVG